MGKTRLARVLLFPSLRQVVRRYACLTCALFLGLLAGTSLLAQTQPNPARPSQTRTAEGSLYSLEGHVLAMGDGNPLNRARVNLVDFQGRSVGFTMTDDEGTFVFYDLPAGTYSLSVTHAGQPEHTERVELTVASIRGMRVVIGDGVRSVNRPSASTVPVWAQKIPEDARKEYELGMKELQAGEWKKCAERMQAALVLYPQYAAAYSNLGTAHFRLDHRKAAEDAYAAALKIDENLLDANLGLGALYSGDKRYPEAEKLLLRARLMKPDEWLILFELGQLYWRMENLPLAEENLARVRVLRPAYPRTYLLLMNVLSSQDKLSRSLAVMNEYLERFPNDSFVAQVRQKRDQLKVHLDALPDPKP